MPGIALDGLDVVVATLAEAGYSAAWDCFRASEAGSPQRRERIFVVGVLPDALDEVLRPVAERGAGAPRSSEPWDCEPSKWDEGLADAPAEPDAGDGVGVSDWRGWQRVLDAGRWDLLQALDESEEAERPVCGMASRLVDSNRIDGLRLLGNGVVPAQAALAFRSLVEELGNARD